MEVVMSKRKRTASVSGQKVPAQFGGTHCSLEELRAFGTGETGYIKPMTREEVSKTFPDIQGLPTDARVNFFALFNADGTPLALTDSYDAAIGHSLSAEIVVETIH